MTSLSRRSFIAGLASTLISSPAAGEKWTASLRTSKTIRLRVTVALGRDRAAPLGTLVQLSRQSGEPICALGFPQVMNHFSRGNPRQIAGFARTDGPLVPAASLLGRSTKVRYRTGVLDGDLIDYTNRERFNQDLGEWEPLNRNWAHISFRVGERLYSVQRVGDTFLAITTERVICDGETIYELNAPHWGACAFWHNGRLFVSCPGYGAVHVFRWWPGERAISTAPESFPLPNGTYARAFAVLDSSVLMATHRGGLFHWRAGVWSTIQSSFEGEFYCIAQIGNTLRIGDYGTGDQWLYDPAQNPAFRKLPNNPPEEKGVGPYGREIQSFALHAGALFHGVYPWGHVHWRDLLNWTWDHVRLFSGPPLSEDFSPFYNDLRALGVPPDEFPGWSRWGQRITALTSWRDGIVASCTNMPGDLFVPQGQEYLVKDLLPDYGRTWFLRMGGACSTEVSWTSSEATVFELEVQADAIVIRQDDQDIATTTGITPSALAGGEISVDVGDGLYGKFGGERLIAIAIETD